MAQRNLISKKYTKAELQHIFKQFKERNLSYEQMASELSVSLRTIARYLKEFGLSQNNELSLTVESVVNLYDSGFTANEIANKFNVSHDAVTCRLHKAGRKINRAENIEKHFNRVHGELWTKIEYDLNCGMSKTAICAKYHLRPDNFERMVREKQYSHSFIGDVTEINSILALTGDMPNSKTRNALRLYMNAILDYIDEYECLPTLTSLARYMNISVQTVSWWFKKHDYTRLLARNIVSTQVSIVEKILSDLSIVYEINNRKLISPFEIDIWLYDLNVGIEVNPSTSHCLNQSRRMHKMTIDYHQKKALECWHKNIRLIQLYDWDIFESDTNALISDLLVEQISFDNVNEVVIDLDKPICRKADLLANGFVESYVNPPICVFVNANTNKITNEQDKQALCVYDSGSITYVR